MLNWLSTKTARRDESESRTVNESGSISGTVEANFDVESPSQSVSHTGTDGVDIKVTNMGAESVGESAASTSKQTTLKRKRSKITIDQCFERVGSKLRKKIRCNVCFKHPDVVKRHNKSEQVPPICIEIGSEIRTEHNENYLKSAIHAAACRANRLQNMSQPELKQESSTIEHKTSKSQNALFWKFGGYMLTVFNDAKRGTLSACSWPSYEAAFQRGKQFL